MSIIDSIKNKFTTASEAVQQTICDHSPCFMGKQPVGTQVIKFEYLYQCSKCGVEWVEEERL